MPGKMISRGVRAEKSEGEEQQEEGKLNIEAFEDESLYGETETEKEGKVAEEQAKQREARLAGATDEQREQAEQAKQAAQQRQAEAQKQSDQAKQASQAKQAE
jgi:hypothetical protein